MDLVLSEEQLMLRQQARELVARRSSLKRIRKLRDSDDALGFSPEIWAEMARLGWVGILIPEEYGGAGLGYVETMVVLEELGRGLMPEPMIGTVLLGANLLLLGGSPAQRREHLPEVAAGRRLLALAHHERGARFSRLQVETRAEPGGGGFRLRGEKTHVLDGHVADWLVVSARSDGLPGERRGLELFLVPRQAPGVEVVRHPCVDGRNAAAVRLAGVQVDEQARLGDAQAGAAILERVLDRATIGLSAEMLGSMSAAFDMTLSYLKTRVQFGVLIGSFQVLQHRAAKMFVELELARSAVLAANLRLDERADDSAIALAASLAKARVSDAAMLIGHEAIQMHGGIGMTDEHDIGFFLKRARAAEMTFGDAAFHRNRFAQLRGF